MTARVYLGIDVGTGSVRAGLFDAAGVMLGVGIEPISVFRPAEDFVQQSSEEIWGACGAAVRSALSSAAVRPEDIAGMGFDATCSMVVLDERDRPVTVSVDGDDAQNVLVWMDHRAIEQAGRINAGEHRVLQYVGGRVSPEMQTPKLLWLRENLPDSWRRAARFFDLPDYLVYRATGEDVRSECTTTCKWTYLAHEHRWDESFFREVGLGDLVDEQFRAVGMRIRPVGERAGVLSEQAAAELGLVGGVPVAVSLIDAHAGGLGVLGYPSQGGEVTTEALEQRMALIGGTSTCHMVVSREPRFVPGVWGPYYAAMVPGMWLSEGGQSATGALIDYSIDTHARGAALVQRAKREGTTVYALLNARLEALAESAPFPASLTRDLHILPDHHGNRSPRADATLRGMVSGLRLTDSVDSLALLYLATIQALAHGTKHVLDVMNAHGHRISTLVATGGDTKNPVFLREHADVTGCEIVLSKEPEAVLLGSAMLGAAASGDVGDVVEAMGRMGAAGRVVKPASGAVSRYHAAKHAVFQRMYEDQMAYRSIMADA
ncbi:MAG: FGGY-family carbohydrate kinase [Myxococcota bacterium]